MSVFTTRPVIMGTNGMVTSTHYLATMSGIQILLKGGNAIDAGAAVWLSLTVLEPWIVGPAGESPILVYSSDLGRVVAVNGQGTAPKGSTIDWFESHGYELIPPDGFLPAVVPGALDAWILALSNFGTMTFGQVAAPAIQLASRGFPITTNFARAIARSETRFREEWPSSAELYLPKGRLPHPGHIFINPDWARTFKRIVDAEEKERQSGRDVGLDAVRRHFYEGPVARAIVDFTTRFRCRDRYGQEHHGLLTTEDLAEYRGKIENTASVDYRGYTVHKCGPWSQGPVFLQQLRLLEGFDLKSMGHNSAQYLHTWIECAKLAYADREEYYADPDSADVPLDILLSKEYASERRKLVDQEVASMELRPGMREPRRLVKSSRGEDVLGTVHLDTADASGNLLSATPSGGWIPTSPIIPGLGFPLGTRGQMFHLDSSHPEKLVPGKRPSTTLTPSLVTLSDQPYLGFGTPGGDQQDQWNTQLFLNIVEFGMDLQEALDSPSVHTTHFPGSFWPHGASPGEVSVEERIPEEVRKELLAKGHKIIVSRGWSHGRCCAIRCDPENGVIYGAASPRTQTPYAVGW